MVYFVHAVGTDYVKIGYCKKLLYKRVASLQTGCPFELRILGYLPGGTGLEWRMHRRYKKDHFRGEWYEFNRGGREVLQANIKKYRRPDKTKNKPKPGDKPKQRGPKTNKRRESIIHFLAYLQHKEKRTIEKAKQFDTIEERQEWVDKQPFYPGYEWCLYYKRSYRDYYIDPKTGKEVA